MRPGGVLTPVVMVWGYFIPVYGSGTVGFACGGGSEGLEGDMGDKGGSVLCGGDVGDTVCRFLHPLLPSWP